LGFVVFGEDSCIFNLKNLVNGENKK